MFKSYHIKAVKYLESLDGHRWPQPQDLDKLWQENANKLKAFVKKYKRLPVILSQDSEEKKLGRWAHIQRRNYKGNGKRILTKEQIVFLESIPGWFWNSDELWQENANELKAFVKKYNRLPSHGSKNLEEQKFGSWVNNQRMNYRGTGSRVLTQEQISFLESIPGWFWENDLDELWQENANKLKAFIKKYKRLPNCVSQDSEENKIGRWVNAQRRNYKKVGGRVLTQEQISFLESIPGWFWENDLDELWQKNANELKSFVDKHNRLPSHGSKNLEEKKIGKWANHQRQNYKGKGKRILTQEQIFLPLP